MPWLISHSPPFLFPGFLIHIFLLSPFQSKRQICPLLKFYYLCNLHRNSTANCMFSKACKYGIRSVIYITKQSQLGRKVGLKEIAKAVDSPEAFTAKILQKLCRSKIIKSEKGPTGGFYIENDKLQTVCLSDIVSTIDGDTVYIGCGLGMKSCNPKKPCPVHDQFMVIRNNLKSMLETTTMHSLASGVKSGLTFLKR